MRGTADILGHRAVLERLWGAANNGTLHHAYLFEGPRGVGKHTVAVRLAMAVNCTGDGDVRPCGACSTCKRIAAGNHPDIIEVGPDPERKTPVIAVEQVREVVRQAGYHRFDARRRVFIVDPAEAMQDAAANALLKTLEEPVPGTGFILIANHASALLPTIVSRCQRVRFSSVEVDALAEWLRKRRVDQPLALARASMGCPGRALELASGGMADRTKRRDALVNVLEGELDGVFDFSQKLTRGQRQEWMPKAVAVVEVVEDLLRDVSVRGSGADVPLLNADRSDLVDAWTRALWPTGARRCVTAVEEAREGIERNIHGRLLLDSLLTRVRHELGLAP